MDSRSHSHLIGRSVHHSHTQDFTQRNSFGLNPDHLPDRSSRILDPTFGRNNRNPPPQPREPMDTLLVRLYAEIKELRLYKPLLPWERFTQKLRKGDHLIVDRKKETYEHHGVYIGNDRVIHLQKSRKSRNDPCSSCGYVPRRNGGPVMTCLYCFHGGSPFFVREYGIRLTSDSNCIGRIDDWILDKLNASTIVYTCRTWDIYLGKWTDSDRNTVIHLISMNPDLADHYSSCERFRYLPGTGRVETCLKCFLRGGLLYIDEFQLSVAKCDGGDAWPSCQDKPIVSMFRKVYGQEVEHVYEVWDSISWTRFGFKKMWERLTAPSFIIYDNEQIQICELACTKSPDEIVETAHRYLEGGFGWYNLIFNNCEHFATACKIDSPTSLQAENRSRLKTDSRIQSFLGSREPPSVQSYRLMETLIDMHLPRLRMDFNN